LEKSVFNPLLKNGPPNLPAPSGWPGTQLFGFRGRAHYSRFIFFFFIGEG
jgi:hypothetical protein